MKRLLVSLFSVLPCLAYAQIGFSGRWAGSSGGCEVEFEIDQNLTRFVVGERVYHCESGKKIVKLPKIELQVFEGKATYRGAVVGRSTLELVKVSTANAPWLRPPFSFVLMYAGGAVWLWDTLFPGSSQEVGFQLQLTKL